MALDNSVQSPRQEEGGRQSAADKRTVFDMCGPFLQKLFWKPL